ncbi:hypothetical protein WKR98_27535 [Pigmentiphaga sp. YJ18]|uniref:hypothetical protein n=1 Tax=Pigmentiphaga sp. YJ18 TaxID=3134907 RepID=UPI0031151E1F
MGFAGLSDDAEGPEAVSAYKATSVEPIIGKQFVRCKKFFGLFTTIRFQISTGKNSFYINRLIIYLAPSRSFLPGSFLSSRGMLCHAALHLPAYFDAKQQGSGKKKPEALRLRANPPKEEGGGDTGR